MVKTLIADDNIQYTRNVMNYIFNKTKNIQFTYIATNGKEVLNILQQREFDLLLLDLKMPELGGIDVLNSIKTLNDIKQPKIIIISGEADLIYRIKENPIISNVINKTETLETIYSKIQLLADRIEYEGSEKNIREQIIRELSTIGYNFKYKGTLYILETIMYIYQNKEKSLLDNLEKYTYKVIACKNKKNVQNIKTSIIKATDLAYLYQDKEVIKKYFSFDVKPTPKVVIATILNKLYKEQA